MSNVNDLFKNINLAEGYKKENEANPVYTQKYGADPYALVHDDTLYLYMTADKYEYDENENIKENSYGKINEINIVSTKDLVNFTDHGCVKVAGKDGICSSASNSWAPAACCKKINGQDQFFMYFANGGNGIGVVVADNPAGPYRDPIGRPFITRETPKCADVLWLFDPAVLVDDDGSAYLYFGGGVPQGKASNPGTARVAKLGADMISLDGEPEVINPPYLFEDSGIHKFNNKYYYTYCSNFSVDEEGTKNFGFTNGTIACMVSDSPMGPFEYSEPILKNPEFFFGIGGNNHHCVFEFNKKWYITYHARALEKSMGISKGYRSTHINGFEFQADGKIGDIKADLIGCEQIKNVNPYEKINATTCQVLAGLNTTQVSENGDCALCEIVTGANLKVSKVDFGATAPTKLVLTVRKTVGNDCEAVQLRLDSKEGEVLTTVALPKSDETEFCEFTFEVENKVTDVHDLYFVFAGSGYQILDWKFER